MHCTSCCMIVYCVDVATTCCVMARAAEINDYSIMLLIVKKLERSKHLIVNKVATVTLIRKNCRVDTMLPCSIHSTWITLQLSGISCQQKVIVSLTDWLTDWLVYSDATNVHPLKKLNYTKQTFVKKWNLVNIILTLRQNKIMTTLMQFMIMWGLNRYILNKQW